MVKFKSFLAAVAVGALLFGGALTAKDKLDGRALYREFCKPCHSAGSEYGEYTPMTLIQMQWQRFFKERIIPSHENVMDQHHGGLTLQVITDEQLKAIAKFAVDHAADSEQPMSCDEPTR